MAAVVGAGVYMRFLPWVVFCFVDRKGGLDIEWAAWLALATGLLVFCIQVRRDQNDISFAGILAVFAALLIVHGVAGPSTAAFLETHSRGLVSAGVGVVLLASLLSGHPAGGAAARRAVPPWAGRTFEFQQLVRRTAIRWAAAMFCLAGLFAASSVFDGPVGKTLFSWLGPLALCLVMVNIDLSCWRRFTTSVSLVDERRHAPKTASARAQDTGSLEARHDEAEHVATVYSLTPSSSLVRES